MVTRHIFKISQQIAKLNSPTPFPSPELNTPSWCSELKLKTASWCQLSGQGLGHQEVWLIAPCSVYLQWFKTSDADLAAGLDWTPNRLLNIETHWSTPFIRLEDVRNLKLENSVQMSVFRGLYPPPPPTCCKARLYRSKLWSKLAEISCKMEEENTMEKCLSVYRACSRILLRWSEVIWLLKSLHQGC